MSNRAERRTAAQKAAQAAEETKADDPDFDIERDERTPLEDATAGMEASDAEGVQRMHSLGIGLPAAESSASGPIVEEPTIDQDGSASGVDPERAERLEYLVDAFMSSQLNKARNGERVTLDRTLAATFADECLQSNPDISTPAAVDWIDDAIKAELERARESTAIPPPAQPARQDEAPPRDIGQAQYFGRITRYNEVPHEYRTSGKPDMAKIDAALNRDEKLRIPGIMRLEHGGK